MEHTASIERPFVMSRAPGALRHVLARVSTATWLFIIQLACYIMRMNVGHGSGLSDLLTSPHFSQVVGKRPSFVA